MRGTVQGVGFRPAMHRLAHTLGLAGFVQNDAQGVWLEIEGDPHAVTCFLDAVRSAAPAAARVESIETRELEPRGDRSFEIADSLAPTDVPCSIGVPIDAAPCDECLRELLDPRDRRFRYPFINCTGCGPRYTIVRSLPYDRPRTTMERFELCYDCRREYEDVSDRRFHAEPNACPVCGPRLRWLEGEDASEGEAALARAVERLAQGAIVAVKGAGGYALAVDANSEEAVARLRRRKRRPHKPFAVMARDLSHARRIAILPDSAVEALRSPARPIVLLPKRIRAPLASSVAPGLNEVGVFLPPTPLQHLLVAEGPPLLVMTSGNRVNEPIACSDEDAHRALDGIADAWLMHDRPIHARADDSVVRPMRNGLTVLRRARGFVPRSITLPKPCEAPVLAVGGHARGAVCLAVGDRAILSPHLGDASDAAGFGFFQEAIEHLVTLAGVEPTLVAHDLHPEYRSTRWAVDCGLPRVAVQHHHAHVAACLVEHGAEGPVLGVAFDGTGFGSDGRIWGGEILEVTLERATRLAQLRPLALAGGEAAVREPWRLAAAALHDAGLDCALLHDVDPTRVRRLEQLLDKGAATVASSGAGRWFDAVAALCGVRREITYDGQAAIELESIAASAPVAPPPYAFSFREREDLTEIDLRDSIRQLVADLLRSADRGGRAPMVAARFHETLAAAVSDCCDRLRRQGAPSTVALTGGCFANRRLTERCVAHLEARGFSVWIHRHVPPNDGGLALGQVAVAAGGPAPKGMPAGEQRGRALTCA